MRYGRLFTDFKIDRYIYNIKKPRTMKRGKE